MSSIDWLKQQINFLDHDLDCTIKNSPTFSKDSELIQSAPGVGPNTANMIQACLPELGTLTRGGIAALVASRHNPVLRDIFLRLRAKGKPAKGALVACMGKLLIMLNAMVRDRAVWRQTAPAAVT